MRNSYFPELLNENDAAVYADGIYKSQKHDEILKEKKIDNRVIKRACRNKPLKKEDKK